MLITSNIIHAPEYCEAKITSCCYVVTLPALIHAWSRDPPRSFVIRNRRARSTFSASKQCVVGDDTSERRRTECNATLCSCLVVRLPLPSSSCQSADRPDLFWSTLTDYNTKGTRKKQNEKRLYLDRQAGTYMHGMEALFRPDPIINRPYFNLCFGNDTARLVHTTDTVKAEAVRFPSSFKHKPTVADKDVPGIPGRACLCVQKCHRLSIIGIFVLVIVRVLSTQWYEHTIRVTVQYREQDGYDSRLADSMCVNTAAIYAVVRGLL